MKFTQNKTYVIAAVAISIIFIFACINTYYHKEGFSNQASNVSSNGSSWSPQIVKQFIQFERTLNPSLVFDMKIVQQQATQKEVEILLETGMWPWSDAIKQIYESVIIRDTIRQINPLDAMNVDRTIYNETAIKGLLGWKTPEGQFLLNGVLVNTKGVGEVAQQGLTGEGTFGIESGLISQNKDLIRCGADGGLQRVAWDGYDGITGVKKEKIDALDYKELPSLLSGFSFIKGACDPCLALNNPSNYTCPFSMTRENGDGVAIVSPIWQVLWGLSGVSAGYQEPSVPARSTAFRVNH